MNITYFVKTGHQFTIFAANNSYSHGISKIGGGGGVTFLGHETQ